MNPPSILETPAMLDDGSARLKRETPGLNRAARRKEARALRSAGKKEARRKGAKK